MTEFRSPLFALADEFVETNARMSPMSCTELGLSGYDDKLDDFTLDEANRQADYAREVLKRAKASAPIDDIDRIGKEVLVERIESNLGVHDSLEEFVTYSPISNPAANIRAIFSIMPTEGKDAIDNIAARLNLVERSLQGWKQTIEEMDALGKKTARRQVVGVAEQLDTFTNGGWNSMVQELDPKGENPALHKAAANAIAASAEMSKWLNEVHAPRSTEQDGVGEERYKPWVSYFTGADLDLKTTYEWGVEELARINDRMHRAAADLGLKGVPLKDVAEYCENSENHRIDGEDNLLQKLKDFTQSAVQKLNGTYFDIDDRIAFCDAKLAPEGSAGAAYYLPPSEDLSRPGSTWYPTLGHTQFNFWHIASTWYHEAVPGHHLQIATAILEKDRLSRFQRSGAWISGYGEGWALYAEKFMDELGAFEDPALELGYLSGQALRAARVVVDIGMHCGYLDQNGQVWNADSALKLLVENAMMAPDYAKSEIERYLGWPGQAISYKVGERYWLEIREAAKQRLGSAFNIKEFHNFALKIGPMGLDALRSEMVAWNGGSK